MTSGIFTLQLRNVPVISTNAQKWTALKVPPLGCHEGLDDWDHGLGLIPLEHRHHQRDPSWPVSKPTVICGSSRRSLENPGLAAAGRRHPGHAHQRSARRMIMTLLTLGGGTAGA